MRSTYRQNLPVLLQYWKVDSVQTFLILTYRITIVYKDNAIMISNNENLRDVNIQLY